MSEVEVDAEETAGVGSRAVGDVVISVGKLDTSSVSAPSVGVHSRRRATQTRSRPSVSEHRVSPAGKGFG